MSKENISSPNRKHSFKKRAMALGIAAASFTGAAGGVIGYNIGENAGKNKALKANKSAEVPARSPFVEGKGGVDEKDVEQIREAIKKGGDSTVLNGSIIHEFTDPAGVKIQWELAYPVIILWQKGPIDFTDINEYMGRTYLARIGQNGEPTVGPASINSGMTVKLNNPDEPLLSGPLVKLKDVVESPNIDDGSYAILTHGSNGPVTPVSGSHFFFPGDRK